MSIGFHDQLRLQRVNALHSQLGLVSRLLNKISGVDDKVSIGVQGRHLCSRVAGDWGARLTSLSEARFIWEIALGSETFAF